MNPHLLTVLLQLADGEKHVGGVGMTEKAALALRQESLFQMAVETVEEKTKGDLSGDAVQRDSSVVVAELADSFPFVETDLSLTPQLLEERCQVIHKLGATVLINLSRDRVRSRRFPAGELLHGPDGFVEREDGRS
nr:unnamed protein product [Spirometra erinaceieuropaei]